jgi:hypothetical protein
MNKPLRIVLLIPDTHRPYHDRKAYALMIRVYQDIVKKYFHIADFEIVILGDYGDFYATSGHDKHPMVQQNLVLEVQDVIAGLDELDTLFPFAKKVYIEGNHEFRLERYLCNKAPALFGVTSTELILKMNQRSGWTFHAYSPSQQYDVGGSVLKARHEPLSNSAKATASKAICSLVYGHIHRLEESHVVGLDGTNHVCFSVGWLGDKRNDKIFGYVKGHHQWQMGFGLVFVDNETKYFYHEKVHILDNYSCKAAGKIYKDE